MSQPTGAADPDLWGPRAAGCLYGVALGDAMGMPGELWPRARVQAHFGRITGFLPGPDGHFVVDGFRAGQVTDDTQQTVMLAEAVIAAGGRVDAEVVAKHLVAWADRVGASEGNFLGPSSARAIAALRAGVPVTETGARGDTNGAAMRIAPVGLISPAGDRPALLERVHAACLCSHNTDIAITGAAMVAAAVAAALDQPDQPPAASVPAVLAAALEVGEQAPAWAAAHGARQVPGASLVRRTSWAQDLAASAPDDEAFLTDLYDLVGATTATPETVPAALALVARAGGDPTRAALLAANLGGDTDTIGAIAAGICGALAGSGAIDPAHLQVLREVNDLDPVEGIAEQLVAYRHIAAGAMPVKLTFGS